MTPHRLEISIGWNETRINDAVDNRVAVLIY